MSSEKREVEQRKTNLIDISLVIDDMWNGFLKYWWLFVMIISVISAVFYIHARRSYTPYYTAYSTFTVNANVAIRYSESIYNQTVAEQIGTIFPYLINSGVLNKLIEDDLVTESVPGNISVSAMEGTNLITLTVTSSTREMAYRILESVIKNYPKVGEFVLGDTKLELMDESGIPALPSNIPNFKSQAIKGAGLGTFLSLLLVVIYALTRNTIRKEDDLKKILNVKCMGVIPKAGFKKRGSVKNPLVMIDNQGIPPMFAEAIRTVRTRVEKEIRESGGKSILVTSAIPGEGKSTIAANLALSLTKRGYSVLLVDGDLRKPAIAKTMGMETVEDGFYEVLNGKIKPEDAAIGYKDTRLKVLPGGKPALNASKILNQEETEKIIEQIRKMADIVIFDTPPSAIMSDAAIIARYVDGILFVVRQDFAKTDRVLEGVEMFANTGTPLSGCILNDAVAGITGYGYGYGYGYGRYGYRKYDYGNYGNYD